MSVGLVGLVGLEGLVGLWVSWIWRGSGSVGIVVKYMVWVGLGEGGARDMRDVTSIDLLVVLK